MNSINVVLTVIMFALFAVAGLLVQFPEKGDDLMVQLSKGQLFTEEGRYFGEIRSIEGVLEQRAQEGTGWKAVLEGEKLFPGLEIRTLADSNAEIFFNDGSILRMSETTQISYENKLYQINIELKNGFIYNKASAAAVSRKYNIMTENYRLETSSATFAVDKPYQGDAEMYIFEGKIDTYTGEEKIATFVKDRRVFLKEGPMEDFVLSEDDFGRREVKWNIQKDQEK